MKLLKTKTVRFSQVIEKCGKPGVYTLWQKPSADRHLQAQLKSNRVMTILKTESGTEFGIAGFREKRRHLSRFSQVIEIVRGQACGRNRLDANQPVTLGLDSFNPSSLKARFSLVGKAGCAVRSRDRVLYRAIPAATPARACQEDAHASGEHFRPHLARS